MATEAGKLYLDWNRDPDFWDAPFHKRFGRYWTYSEVIAAIEAEAEAAARIDEADNCAAHTEKAVAAERAGIAAAVRDPAEWLNSCSCVTINPRFGEGQPGGHFSDCAWVIESDVRDDILDVVERP